MSASRQRERPEMVRHELHVTSQCVLTRTHWDDAHVIEQANFLQARL